MAIPILSIEAYFDCLSIAAGVPSSVAPASTRELHLLGYLARLLALFEGEPLADWGYAFALTSRGFPHSAAFEIARIELAGEGHIEQCEPETFVATARGRDELMELMGLSFLASRSRWLNAAADCSLALPMGSIRYALTSRNDLLGSGGSGQPRELVTPAYLDRVHSERTLIEDALGGESADLLAPAVAWLSIYVLEAREQLAA
ncbi:hypothetical protein ASE06_15985 [Sphingopyxis sp. Root214]|uniref:hypothetical protein n=1 Tax=unclassified Sphingopyxis TaxID=2614943 RepID=UPI0006F1E031|nr:MULTISPECIES: hypothetical protein [unclassified Sphingopyxis]KQZ73829.1 hypothetical protein ASD73_13640 [Sphingopyxis sp. Root154]KRC07970.1 hypothetical protein ASE06_15985 [Sphingopyxis sp. Root214]